MRGTRYGDFSRLPESWQKGYRSVLMQQGRVQLDADWNEQQEIITHRLDTETRDLIGASGAPLGNAGFGVIPQNRLVFDGIDDFIYVERPEGLSFGERGHFTLEAWINPRQTNATGTIISKFNADGSARSIKGEYFLDIEADGAISFHRIEFIGDKETEEVIEKEPGLEIFADIEMKMYAIRTLTTNRKLQFGRFSHVAVTFNGYETRIYLDGHLAAQQTTEWDGVRSRHAPVLIGARMFNEAPALFYGGMMGDMRIWKVARTHEQIRHDMHRKLGGHEHGLVAYWQLEEATGAVIRDLTDHHHDGLLGRGSKQSMPDQVPSDFLIGKGRYYVDGILCENETDVRFTNQPDYPDAVLPDNSQEPGVYVAYLDAWERFISAVEDPSIRDVALGGPDTTGRVQVVAQVKLLPVEYDGEATESDEGAHLRYWHGFAERMGDTATMSARRQMTGFLGNQLYRVEVHSGGWLYGWPGPEQTHGTQVSSDGTQWTVSNLVVDGIHLQGGELVEIYGEHEGEEKQTGELMRVTAVEQATKTLALQPVASPTSGAPASAAAAASPSSTGLRLRPIATFKWSRENGSVVFPIESISAQDDQTDSVITLKNLGQDVYMLSEKDWVEIVDDDYVLCGRAEYLCRVKSIDRINLQVTLQRPPPPNVGRNPSLHPLLRRWDQRQSETDAALVGGTIPISYSSPEQWLNLENGIQVSFAGPGLLHTGDYWLIPSRTDTGDIEWPTVASVPVKMGPLGIKHHYAALALLRFDESGMRVRDLRRVFAPLSVPDHPHEDHRFVRKTGDKMTGALDIESSLHVKGETHVNILHAHTSRTETAHARTLHAETLSAETSNAENLRAENLRAETLSVRTLRAEILDAETSNTETSNTQTSNAETANAQTLNAEILRAESLSAGTVNAETLRAGETYVELLHGELAADTVGEQQLVDKSVTRAKLADDVGNLWSFPYGYSILGDTQVPPVGFSYTQSFVVTFNHDAQWETKAEIAADNVTRLASAVVNNRIYSFTDSGIVLEYDIQSQVWQARAQIPTQSQVVGVAAVRDKIYAFFKSREVWELDPFAPDGQNAWVEKSSIPTRRQDFGVAVAHERIYVMGGERRFLFGLFRFASRRNEEFDPFNNTWAQRSKLLTGRYAFGTGVINHRICLLGGKERLFFGLFGRRIATNEHYSVSHNVWSTGPAPISSPRREVGVATFEDRIYAIGGEGRDGWYVTNEMLNHANMWTEATPLRRIISTPNVLVINGRFYVLGMDTSRPGTCVVEEWPIGSIFYVHRKNYSVQ
jgi:hypothetical protein